MTSDVYDPEFLEYMLDKDAISDTEEAFMEGYLQAYY